MRLTACPRCGSRLDRRSPQRCTVCRWRASSREAPEEDHARGDGGYRGRRRSSGSRLGSRRSDTDPARGLEGARARRRPVRGNSRRPIPRPASEFPAPDPWESELAGSSEPLPGPAEGDGLHSTASLPETDTPEPAASSSWISGTTVRGRVAEVLPQQHETVDRRAESTATSLATGCLMMPFRILGFILGMIFLKPLALALVSGRRQSRPLDPVQVPVTPFRLEADDGTTMHCALRGDLFGGALSLGDYVEVQGRVSRSTNVLNVKRVVHLDSGTLILPRLPAAARKAKVVPWLVLLLGLLVAIMLFSILL